MESRRNLNTTIIACVLAAGACTPQPTVYIGTLTVSTASAPPPPPQGSGGGECDHEYFPMDEDTTWEYAGSSNILGDDRTTRTIIEERDDGFTMTQRTSTGDVVLNLTYACTDGGLILLDPMQQFFAGSASGASGQAIITTQGQSGITLPADLRAGLTWQQYVEGTVSGPDVTLHMTYTFDYVARGLELVTVPLGTFDAMRIDTETQGTLEGENSGTCQTSTWYVKDIGVVKELTICGIGASSIEVALELDSYDSP